MFTFLFLAGNFQAHAALVNVDLFDDGTDAGFTIEGSNLEWVDFGHTNNLTIQDALALTEKEQYLNGFHIASFEQVHSLWTTLFYSTANYINLNIYGVGYHEAYLLFSGEFNDLWANYIPITGFNKTEINYTYGIAYTSMGLFKKGDMYQYAFLQGHYGDFGSIHGSDVTWIGVENRSLYEYYNSYHQEHVSTFLVREIHNVREPNLFTLLIMLIIGAVFRKVYKR